MNKLGFDPSFTKLVDQMEEAIQQSNFRQIHEMNVKLIFYRLDHLYRYQPIPYPEFIMENKERISKIKSILFENESKYNTLYRDTWGFFKSRKIQISDPYRTRLKTQIQLLADAVNKGRELLYATEEISE